MAKHCTGFPEKLDALYPVMLNKKMGFWAAWSGSWSSCWQSCLWQRVWNLMTLEDPSNPSHSILWWQAPQTGSNSCISSIKSTNQWIPQHLHGLNQAFSLPVAFLLSLPHSPLSLGISTRPGRQQHFPHQRLSGRHQLSNPLGHQIYTGFNQFHYFIHLCFHKNRKNIKWMTIAWNHQPQ